MGGLHTISFFYYRLYIWHPMLTEYFGCYSIPKYHKFRITKKLKWKIRTHKHYNLFVFEKWCLDELLISTQVTLVWTDFLTRALSQ